MKTLILSILLTLSSAHATEEIWAKVESSYVTDYKNLIMEGDEDLFWMNLSGINAFDSIKHFTQSYACGSRREQTGTRRERVIEYIPDYVLRPEHRTTYSTYGNHSVSANNYEISRVIMRAHVSEVEVPVFKDYTVYCDRLIPYIFRNHRWNYKGHIELRIKKEETLPNYILSSGVRKASGQLSSPDQEEFYVEAFNLFPRAAWIKFDALTSDERTESGVVLRDYKLTGEIVIKDMSSWFKSGFMIHSRSSDEILLSGKDLGAMDTFKVDITHSSGKDVELVLKAVTLGSEKLIRIPLLKTRTPTGLKIRPHVEGHGLTNEYDFKNVKLYKDIKL